MRILKKNSTIPKQRLQPKVPLTVGDICRNTHIESSSNGPNTDGACVRRTAWKRKNESIDVSVCMSDVSVRKYTFMSLKKNF
jgi:hypothetical protein